MNPVRRQVLRIVLLTIEAGVGFLCLQKPVAAVALFLLTRWCLGLSDPQRPRSLEVRLLAGWISLLPVLALQWSRGLTVGKSGGVLALLLTASWLLLPALHRRLLARPLTIRGCGPGARRAALALRNLPFASFRPAAFLEPCGQLEELEGLPVRRGVGEGTAAPCLLGWGAQGEDPIPVEFGRGDLVLSLPDGGALMGLEGPGEGLSFRLKRILDLALSLPVAVTLGLPALAVALVVRLRLGSPVLVSQERLTLNRKPFHLLKFRSMIRAAEPGGVPVWPRSDDPRITPLGRHLRRFWIDEWPQLWNVLRGDLSLVGPRPERPLFAQVFSLGLPKYHMRYRTLAGVTGLAQVMGFAGNTSLRKRLTCDRWYIDHWRPSLDLALLFLTLCRLFRRPKRQTFDYVPVPGERIP